VSIANALREAKTASAGAAKGAWKGGGAASHPCPAASIALAVSRSGAEPFINAARAAQRLVP
jgi:hypothetical protein